METKIAYPFNADTISIHSDGIHGVFQPDGFLFIAARIPPNGLRGATWSKYVIEHKMHNNYLWRYKRSF